MGLPLAMHHPNPFKAGSLPLKLGNAHGPAFPRMRKGLSVALAEYARLFGLQLAGDAGNAVDFVDVHQVQLGAVQLA